MSKDKDEPTYDEAAIKALEGLEQIRRRPSGHITTELIMLTDDEIAAIELENRVHITREMIGDLEYIQQDVALLANMAEGLPMQAALQALAEPLAAALDAVRAQVEADKS